MKNEKGNSSIRGGFHLSALKTIKMNKYVSNYCQYETYSHMKALSKSKTHTSGTVTAIPI